MQPAERKSQAARVMGRYKNATSRAKTASADHITCASGEYLLLIRKRTPAHDRCRLEAGRPSMRMQPAERKSQAARVMGRWKYATSRAKTASADHIKCASGQYLLIHTRTPARDLSRFEAGRPSMRMRPAENHKLYLRRFLVRKMPTSPLCHRAPFLKPL